MKHALALVLILFGSLGIEAKSIYLSCNTLNLRAFTESGLITETFSRNERVKSLEMNQEEDRVVWDGYTSEFIPDGNRDNVYEMKFKNNYSSRTLKFNQITKSLNETVFIGDEMFQFEYQCEIATPLFR